MTESGVHVHSLGINVLDCSNIREPGLAVDVVQAKLYYSTQSGTIFRANLDGSDREAIVDGLGFPAGIALDHENHLLYFTDLAYMLGAGKHSRSEENMAAAVAPYVESGEFVLIGECSDEMFAQTIERAASFKKLFSVFPIEPQSDEVIGEIIEPISVNSSEKLSH